MYEVVRLKTGLFTFFSYLTSLYYILYFIMRLSLPNLFLLLFLFIVGCKSSQPAGPSSEKAEASQAGTLPSIGDHTEGMGYYGGFMPFYLDAEQGKLLLEVGQLNQEFLYVNYLSSGIGSNDIGLDRGQIGNTRVVKFVRSGNKLLLLQPNYDYRAVSENADEQASVEEAFAQSVLWSFPLVAQDDWKLLVDATEFFLQDAHGVAQTLKQSKQGTYQLNTDRSALYMERTKNFPKNTEVEALLTFTGEPQGSYIRQVTPSPEAVSVRLHHSLVELPDSWYSPRPFDPRAGYFGISYADYATPIDEPLQKRFIARHRLYKENPGAALSEAVEPIVYYLDRGTPEPVRSALLEGASWWNEAFQAAGYKNAFRVEMLPEGADPLDVRYNVIQWVHRATRGWSYGATVTDPRTGEILKGHVSLGSLRVRQDILIAEGLLAPYAGETEKNEQLSQMALDRLKQLSAHEVGHTLGLSHNFAASASGRTSVMDYPHPLAILREDGNIDLSETYDTGIGEWDKMAIRYGYQDFDDEADEEAALEAILDEMADKGLLFISDADARPVGGAHPYAHLWDNGVNPVNELERILEIRGHALQRFGTANIKSGAPMATLEEVLVPLYLSHRYQTEAVAKLLGGIEYGYTVKEEDTKPTAPVPAHLQKQALQALLQSLEPEVLRMPEHILPLIPPRPPGYSRNRETFGSHMGVAFDPLAAAESAAGHSLSLLLHPERAARLSLQQALNPAQPGFSEVLQALMQKSWPQQFSTGYDGQLQQLVARLSLQQLLQLAAQNQAGTNTQGNALQAIYQLQKEVQQRLSSAPAKEQALYQWALQQIRRFEQEPESFKAGQPLDLPPGSPIGSDMCAN